MRQSILTNIQEKKYIMSKYTKIVATISDNRCDVGFIKSLYENGMNVVRMNSAHMQREGFEHIIANVRKVSNAIGILMDTKGPEIRTTVLQGDTPITFEPGQHLLMTGRPGTVTTSQCIGVSYPAFAEDIPVGSHVLIDDGELEFLVCDKVNDELMCEALNAGELGSRKSVNVPGVRINLPSLTQRDRDNILIAIENNIDFIAHSFVRSKQDVLDIQHILDEHRSPIKIIAKIENQEGVDNIDEILEVAYGVMVARGDLGIEVPQEKIPGIQQLLIRKCIQAKKPVIVATQLLHSMIKNPRPTRAEVTDIANAIYNHTDALMLSGETAYGRYPVESVATMARVAMETERTRLIDSMELGSGGDDITAFLAQQAVKSSTELGTKAIITDSYTGRTARFVASYRGRFPVLALCYNERTIRQLSLSYGVFAMYQKSTDTSRQYLFNGLTHLLEKKLLTREDLIAYLGGSFGSSHGTTFLEINHVGKVLDSFDNYVLPNIEEI